jgi:high affinity Mn2+ porin
MPTLLSLPAACAAVILFAMTGAAAAESPAAGAVQAAAETDPVVRLADGGQPPAAAPTPQTDNAAPPTGTPTAPADTPAAPQDWAIHAQSTFTDQAHPGFQSAYSGPNSLDSGRRGDETFDATILGGVRPWTGAEVWVNAEIDQGFGLDDTLGIAAFPSAEAYKVGSQDPYVRVPRLFLRQTIDLGGAVQGVSPDLNQLGGAQTADHLVLTIGKFGVTDVFDTNKFAHDPRNDFLNWAVIDGGAFDYAADAWGYSYAATAEWYQDWWTLRAGIADGSVQPNSPELAFPLGSQFQLLAEAEARYALFGQDSKIKLLGFQTRAKLGTFAELEQFYTAHPGATLSDAEVVRHLRNKFGAEINLEQPLTDQLGAFLRASLNDGRTETYEFTDITRSVSAGLSLAGKTWGRPDDTIGAAFVVSTISHAFKDYLADGFLGLLIGDGKLLNAGPEQVLETYYSFAVRPGIAVTADYQLVNHPAYNVDRGPVNIMGARVHVQF